MGDKSAGRLISCVLSVPYVSAFVLVVPSHRQCFHLLEDSEVQEFDYLGLRLDPKLKIALHRIQETLNLERANLYKPAPFLSWVVLAIGASSMAAGSSHKLAKTQTDFFDLPV